MLRTQVYLTANKKRDLESLSKEIGLSQSEIIRQAINFYLELKKTEKRNKRDALKSAAPFGAS